MPDNKWTLELLNETTEEINIRIREALGATGVKHSEVAKAMGVGRANVTNQLTGKPTNSLRLVITVSELTGYDEAWLIYGVGIHRYPKNDDPRAEWEKIKSEHPMGDVLDAKLKEGDRIEAREKEMAEFAKRLEASVTIMEEYAKKIDEFEENNPQIFQKELKAASIEMEARLTELEKKSKTKKQE